MIAPPKAPPTDELEALIREARERQWRRRLLLAAGAAIALALGLGLYLLTTSGGGPSATGGPGAPAGLPLCRSSQISVGRGNPIGVVSFGPTDWLTLTNKSGATCSLSTAGAPTVRITWHGRLLPTREEQRVTLHPGAWQPLRTVRVLRPGGKAGITYLWLNWCGPPHSDRPMMTAHLRFDRALSISFPIGPRPSCRSRGAPSVVEVSRPLLARG